mmetsp:Transcript_74665/g.175219  ORF Transcript_74665/g.175219 Transcript_74665/m.175219 type:complete len:104 (-) Transcript_74665:1094-1405(-)
MCSGQGASAPDLSPPWVQLLTVSTLVTDEDGEASDSGSFGGGVEVDVMATGGSDDVMATDDDDATFGPPVPDGLGVRHGLILQLIGTGRGTLAQLGSSRSQPC